MTGSIRRRRQRRRGDVLDSMGGCEASRARMDDEVSARQRPVGPKTKGRRVVHV